MSISRPEIDITSLIKESEQFRLPDEKDKDFYNKFERWVSIRNIINMYRVCYSFYTNRLHYTASKKINPKTQNKEDALLTSLPEFERIFLHDPIDNQIMIKSHSYRIKQGKDAAKTLKALLYSYTQAECTSSIHIAFFLTLYDVIQLIHGEKAEMVFNTLFGSEQSCDQRFTISNTMTFLTDNPGSLLSVIQYFGLGIPNICLDDLIAHPSAYTGLRLYVKGHPDYRKKHPLGAGAGWNVIFCGLSDNKEPLFLGARSSGKEFIMTYHALISLLTQEFNQLPETYNEKYLNQTALETEMEGLNSYGGFFAIEKLLELKDIEKINKNLNNFIKTYRHLKFEEISVSSFIKNPNTLFPTSATVIKNKIYPFTALDTDVLERHYNKKVKTDVEKLTLNPHYHFKPKRTLLVEEEKTYYKEVPRGKKSASILIQ